MANELYIHTLRQLRDGCKAEHMDTETAALDAAIKALSCDGDCISRQAAKRALEEGRYSTGYCKEHGIDHSISMEMVRILLNDLPSTQPEIIRCCKCCFWDRDTLRHQFNDFRDWNEAECMILADRDPYHEINRYTEADDFCSRAERREENARFNQQTGGD